MNIFERESALKDLEKHKHAGFWFIYSGVGFAAFLIFSNVESVDDPLIIFALAIALACIGGLAIYLQTMSNTLVQIKEDNDEIDKVKKSIQQLRGEIAILRKNSSDLSSSTSIDQAIQADNKQIELTGLIFYLKQLERHKKELEFSNHIKLGP